METISGDKSTYLHNCDVFTRVIVFARVTV